MPKLKLLAPAAALALVVGCTDLEVTNPNQRTTDTFWQNQNDAMAGLSAAYSGLQQNGVFGRWLWFVSDARTDVGTSRSPWTDLANWTRTVLVTPNFGPNQDVWNEHYRALFRANQVIASLPNVTSMSDEARNQMTAEAKFIRGLIHYQLALLFGPAPIVTTVLEPGQYPESSQSVDQVYAQAAKDFTEAAAALPPSWTGNNTGRATRGAALSMLAKVHLQQRRWAEAASTFGQVRSLGVYRLAPTYAENFTYAGNNNVESVFEVQFGGPSQLAQGTRGLNIAKLVGPPGFAFTDVQPTEWMFQQYFAEGGRTNPDPRLDATVFWNKPGGMLVHGKPFAQLYPNGFKDTGIDKTYFWKKYEEYWLPVQDWDAALNAKVVRFAEVLLGQAEALNEAGQTAQALEPLNLLRARAGVPAIPAGISQADLRRRIEHEWLMEFGWENKRLGYLKRHNKFNKETLLPHDPDFVFFVNGRSELLPIPQTEVDLNPQVKQNPGW